jgi:hypothetical protein
MQGSTASYIIVSIILSISVLGGVLLIQNRSKDTSSPVPAASNEKSNPSKTTASSPTGNEPIGQSTKKPEAKHNIPETGLSSNMIISILMISALVVFSAAYYQSRILAEGLLDK